MSLQSELGCRRIPTTVLLRAIAGPQAAQATSPAESVACPVEANQARAGAALETPPDRHSRGKPCPHLTGLQNIAASF